MKKESKKMRLSLLISMYNEIDTVNETIANIHRHLAGLAIVRSTDDPEPFKNLAVEGKYVIALPDLSPQLHHLELSARTLARNFSKLFSMARKHNFDYDIIITGDTKLLHIYGIEAIIKKMEEQQAILGCSKACGQDFHSAELTIDDLAQGKGGGRKQGLDVPDYQPQLWVVKHSAVKKGAFNDISVVNCWCSEECLGAAMGLYCREKWKEKTYVFSKAAYDYQDGCIYHADKNIPEEK